MANFDLKYGKKSFGLNLKDDDFLGLIDERTEKREKTEEEVILDALENPIGSARLRDIVKEGQSVCVIVSDVTRAWQKMGRYMHYIVDEILKGGVKEEDIFFISATGTHRAQTKEEHELLLGPKLAGKYAIYDHISTDSENMTFLGTTSYGTKVELNKKALEADHIVITGAIVYHFMAGWGGGRKSILPGISSYDTVQANHALALDPEPGKGRNKKCSSGNFKDNVLHYDMVEAAQMVNPSFLFNVIMDDKGDIGHAVAGHWREAHEAGTSIVDRIDGIEIEKLADMAVATAGGYPKDINFYQTSKTIFNCMECVKKGGNIVIVSSCSEGFGSDAVRQLLLDYPDTVSREVELRKRFSIARYVAYVIGYVAENWNLILVSEMDPEILAPVGIKVYSSLDKAMDSMSGKTLKTYVLPHGANTLPKLK